MKKILLIIMVSILFSCKKENVNNNSEVLKKQKTEFNVLNYTKTNYLKYFDQTDNTIGINALKYTNLKDYQTSLNIKGDFSNKKSFLINNFAAKNFRKQNRINLFGKNNSFIISANDNVHKIIQDTIIDLYIPKLIKITNPIVNNVEEKYPKCKIDDFIIKWNPDSNNPNGLYVIVDYNGENAIPQDSETKRVVNVDYIANDNGVATLNPDLFQDIPNLAFAVVSLIRGDIKVLNFNDETYKIYAESHMELPIIVVKNMDRIEKR